MAYPKALFALAVAVLISVCAAQQQNCSTLVNNLAPCLSVLQSNSTPGANCCNPLRTIVQTNITCLCEVASSGAGIVSLQDALQLPIKCQIKNVTAATCGFASAPAPAPAAQSGGHTPGSNSARSTYTHAWISCLVVTLASVSF